MGLYLILSFYIKKYVIFTHIFFNRFVAYLLRDAITRRMRAIHNRVILTHLSPRLHQLHTMTLLISKIMLHLMMKIPLTSSHARQWPRLAQGTIRPPLPLFHTILILLTL